MVKGWRSPGVKGTLTSARKEGDLGLVPSGGNPTFHRVPTRIIILITNQHCWYTN